MSSIGRTDAWRLGGNAAWLTANRAIRLAANIAILGAVGRYLAPEQFGQLNFAIGLATLFMTVANLGFEGIVIRELIRLPSETGRVLGTAFLLRLAGALAAIPLVAGAAAIGGDTEILLLAVIVAMAFLPSSADVIELWFQKNLDARSMFWVRVAATLTTCAVRVALIWQNASVEAFAWTQLFESAIGMLGLAAMFHLRGGVSLFKWRWDTAMAARILSLSWPLILSGLLIAIYARVEQLMVKAVLGDYTLGIYYASIRISEAWAFLPPVLLMTLYPMLVTLRDATNPEAFQQRLQMVFDLLTGLGYAIAIAITLTAPLLIPLVFGEHYRAAIPILIIQAWTAPILFSGAARAQYFLLENLNIYHTLAAVIGIGVNVTLSLWWMQYFGAEGAAISAMVSSLIAGYGTSFLFPRLHTCTRLQTRGFLVPFRLPHAINMFRNHL